MKLIFTTLFLFAQSFAFSAGSSSSVDANKEYLKAEKLIKTVIAILLNFILINRFYWKCYKIWRSLPISNI